MRAINRRTGAAVWPGSCGLAGAKQGPASSRPPSIKCRAWIWQRTQQPQMLQQACSLLHAISVPLLT